MTDPRTGRTLAEHSGWGVPSRSPPFTQMVLGPVAQAHGDGELAWAMVREGLPEGPATAPGEAWFIEGLALQRLAATLALDAGNLTLASSWLAAHDRWLAASGSVLGRAESHLAWATYHRQADDPAQARQHAEQALARAAEPRQPLALLAAHRLLAAGVERIAGTDTIAVRDGKIAAYRFKIDPADPQTATYIASQMPGLPSTGAGGARQGGPLVPLTLALAIGVMLLTLGLRPSRAR